MGVLLKCMSTMLQFISQKDSVFYCDVFVLCPLAYNTSLLNLSVLIFLNVLCCGGYNESHVALHNPSIVMIILNLCTSNNFIFGSKFNLCHKNNMRYTCQTGRKKGLFKTNV